MRGYPSFNFPAFVEATWKLRDKGHEVISPAEHDLDMGFDPTLSIEENNFDVKRALAWDISQIIDPDTEALYMMKDWEASTGASIEHSVAYGIGLQIQYESAKDTTKYIYRAHTAVAR
jgi:hypothetical protein